MERRAVLKKLGVAGTLGTLAGCVGVSEQTSTPTASGDDESDGDDDCVDPDDDDGAADVAGTLLFVPRLAFEAITAPVYGTQFHSELDADAERERLIAYRDYYVEELGSEEQLQSTIASLADTTEVDHLLHDFLRVCVCDLPPSITEETLPGGG